MTQAPRFFVGHKQQVSIGGGGFDDLDRVAAGANHIAERLDLGAAIDIHDRVEIRIGLLQLTQCSSRAAFFERTAGVPVRENHQFVGIEYLRRFGHEVDAAEHDDLGVGRDGLLRQTERVAHEVGQILNLRNLIVVRQKDGLQLAFQVENFAGQRLGF